MNEVISLAGHDALLFREAADPHRKQRPVQEGRRAPCIVSVPYAGQYGASFVEEQVDKRNKLYKKVKELGYGGASASRKPS